MNRSKFLGMLLLPHKSSHFLAFSWNIFLADHFSTCVTAFWTWLFALLYTISDMVVLSTNSQLVTSWDFRSLIINTNNHGPNLFPSETPERTSPHSEKRSCDSLARCFSVCQEVGHPARNAWGIFRLKIVCKRFGGQLNRKPFCTQT